MSSLQPNDPVRQFLSKIGRKGGKTVTPKKLEHLNSIHSMGGKTVTPKKLEALAKARAARAAKAKSKKENVS